MSVAPVRLKDLEPDRRVFLKEALKGLSASPKTLACKYFYDERGSRLFDAICDLPEYYPTRTEMEIMRGHAGEMADILGPRCMLVEYGSGSSLKTRFLLDRLKEPAAYVPVDISREHLLESARRLSQDYPGLSVLPVCADYLESISLPAPPRPPARTAVYFPGSTIGNFEPPEAVAFLRRAARLCGSGGGLLIGVDLQKDDSVLTAAYNDSQGVTAAFNKNVLRRMNEELGADFDLDAFEHRAVYERDKGRIAISLVSLRAQEVHLGGETIAFRKDEAIQTEYSYKFTVEQFAELAAKAGFRLQKVWTDDRSWFSVQYFDVA